jgi:hypothetical protein
VTGSRPLASSSFVINERDGEARRLGRSYVIGEAQLDRHLGQRNASDQICGHQEGQHRRQHQVKKIVARVPGRKTHHRKEDDKEQPLYRHGCSDGEAQYLKPHVASKARDYVERAQQRKHERDGCGHRREPAVILLGCDRAEQRDYESDAEKEDCDEEIAPRLPVHTSPHSGTLTDFNIS